MGQDKDFPIAGPSRSYSFPSSPLVVDGPQDEQHGQVPMERIGVGSPKATIRWNRVEGDYPILPRQGGATDGSQPTVAPTGASRTVTGASQTEASTTFSDLFPTSSQASHDNDGGRGTNVYYLVFLGVLVILLCVAACLTYRAFRIRRRYRTATQRAIARGDRLPPELNGDRDDFWGLGGLAAWNSDGMDRFPLGAGGAALVGGAGAKWQRIPVLCEYAVDSDDEKHAADTSQGRDLVGGSKQSAGDIWWNTKPLAVQSLLPPDEDLSRSTAPEVHTWRNLPRMSSPRPRQSPRHGISSYFGHRRRQDLYTPDAADQEVIPEIDRYLEDGEELRIGVVIEMPTEDQDSGRKSYTESEDDRDEIGWKPNMELGVWEGSARRRYR